MRDRIRIYLRFARYLERVEPGYLVIPTLAKILEVLQLFIPLYLSRYLIRGILSGAPRDRLLIVAIAASVSFFLMSILSGIGSRRAEYHYQRLFKKHQVNKALALFDRHYGDTELDEVQNRLASLKQLERFRVTGLRSFQENFRDLWGSSLAIVIGLLLIRPLLTIAPVDSAASGYGTVAAQWGFAALYLAVVLLLHWIGSVVDSRVNQKFAKQIVAQYKPNQRYLNTYGNLLFDYKTAKDIKLYCAPLVHHYNETFREIHGATYRFFFRLFSASGMKRELIAALLLGANALFVGYKAVIGSVPMSDVFLCLGVLGLLFQHAQVLVEAIAVMRSSDEFRRQTFEILPSMPVPAAPVPAAGASSTGKTAVAASDPAAHAVASDSQAPAAPTLEIRNVSFRYPNAEQAVLHDVSLRLEGKQKLALVGRNGSGKSTLIKLLLGLYQPTEGEIWIHGESTANWSADDFVDFFSVVFQDFQLLALRIGDNVATSDVWDEDAVRADLTKTGLGDFVRRHGTESYLYRDFETAGIEVSGGEAQKIAMARAIHHGGRFFVLDEPTAALDPISEYEIYTHFSTITSDHPTIYISHRLSSCKFCDVVAVMEEGRIAEFGTHDALLARGGLYASLWNAQAQHYDLG